MPDDDIRRVSSLGDALDGFLKSRKLLDVSREKLCPLIWGDVVGDWYNRFTQVSRVHDGIVFVRCDSAPRAHQLQLDAPRIIEQMKELLGEKYVKELRPSSTGSASKQVQRQDQAPLEPPTDEELAAIELAPGVEERIRAKAAELDDDELRPRLERILHMRARLQVWKAEHGFTRCPECGGYFRGAREYCFACRPAPPPPREGGEEGLSPYRK